MSLTSYILENFDILNSYGFIVTPTYNFNLVSDKHLGIQCS